jgi:hypothetical protein
LKPECLLLASDPQREPRTFQLLLCRDLGMKRSGASGSFVSETQRQAVDFYRSVVQTLRPWRAPAPTLPPPEQDAVVGVDDEASAQLVMPTAAEPVAHNASVSSSSAGDPN